MAMHDRHRRALEPLQARLGMLQRACCRADDLTAELQKLRDRKWELEERIATVAGLDDHELENGDTAERRAINHRVDEIRRILKVLRKDSETDDAGIFKAPSPEIESRIERAKWMAELQKWPRVFVERLSREIEIRSAPERIHRTLHSTDELYDGRYGSNESYAYRLSQALAYLAKARAAEGDIEDGKCRVLWALFAYGRRRIVREEVQPMLEKMVREQFAYTTDRLTRVREWSGRIERRLPNPVYARGPKKGMPLSEARRLVLEEELAQYRDEARKLECTLQRLSDPDPLYASGFWRRPVKRAATQPAEAQAAA
jgi:hypothetical protein